MILAMTIMLMVLGLSTRLLRVQSTSVATQEGRLSAQQNSRFALSQLDRELRVAGVGVADAQPLVVMAGATAVTFNADLVSLDTADLGSVYINPDADSAAVDVLRTSTKITLPGTAKLYPDTTYMQNVGVPSNAETISYYLSQDSTSTHLNEYILFRRVNALPPRVVARGIIYNGVNDTIFQYFKTDTLGALTPISPALLPLIHLAPIHGSPGDTATSALTDSIKQVRVQFTSVYHDPRTRADTFRRMQMTVHLMNAGLIRHPTCGNAPLGVTATAVVTPADGITVFQPYVTVSWTASVDDGGGEKDVERYAVYRRLVAVPNFDEPFASAPGGSPPYSLKDADVASGQTWIYGVAAQDCTPMSSPIAQTAPVVIP
jgi:hypothetical protein